MKYVVTLNGKQFEVEVEKVDGGRKSLSRQPVGRGERKVVEEVPVVKEVVETKATSETTAPVASTGAGTDVTSPMPGSILDVKVKVGDTVKYGDVLAILEAMKMENDIPAPVDGIVADIKVKKGDMVETDAVLIVIK